MRVLYEGGLISKRKYTSVRNSSDIVKQSDNGLLRNLKTEIMQGCEIPKIIPYKTLMTHIRNIDIGEVLGLEILAEKFSTEAVPGVYRPLKPLLLKLADLYLLLHGKKPCLHWFNGEESVFYVAVGADGAPFDKDDTATAYLVSFIKLRQRVQSCNDNHLLLGANCEEDHVLMKSYSSHLASEMREIEGKTLVTPQGKQVIFRFELIPADMKWMASHSGELNNSATYFSSFANVNSTNKHTVGGTIGGRQQTRQPWDYDQRLKVAEKVDRWALTGSQSENTCPTSTRLQFKTKPVIHGISHHLTPNSTSFLISLLRPTGSKAYKKSKNQSQRCLLGESS